MNVHHCSEKRKMALALKGALTAAGVYFYDEWLEGLRVGIDEVFSLDEVARHLLAAGVTLGTSESDHPTPSDF